MKCLYCYKSLAEGERDMHAACVKTFFGTNHIPTLDDTIKQLDDLAKQVIQDQTSLTGVQPKLSLHLQEYEGSKRLTLVGLWELISVSRRPHIMLCFLKSKI